MAPRSLRTLTTALALAAALTGCRSLSSYHFGPSPQAHELALEGKVTPIARAQLSALGFSEAGDGLVLSFRLRLTNPETPGLRLHRAGFTLVDGALTPFGPPRFRAVPGDDIHPGSTVVVDVDFPLPHRSKPKELDLTGLVLTWGVTTDEQEYVTTARFEELWYYYPCGCGHVHWGPTGYYHAGHGWTYHYAW